MLTPLNELAFHIHENAKDKGWWDDERQLPEIVALIHSEVSEALEEYRNGREPTEVYYPLDEFDIQSKKPEGVPIELADVIIRICDYAAHAGIDLDEAVRIKMAYNKTRLHRHGGKRA